MYDDDETLRKAEKFDDVAIPLLGIFFIICVCKTIYNLFNQ